MINTLSRTNLGLNRQTYQRLKAALRLNLRRQVFISICDNLVLRDRLAAQLQDDLLDRGNVTSLDPTQAHPTAVRTQQPYPRLVSIYLDVHNPDPVAGIAQWLTRNKANNGRYNRPMPAFQLMGVEQLTRQPAAVQWLFLNYLQGIERSLPALESSLLLWVPRPWARMIPQSAPDFWRCRTAVFEFEGEPTPLTFTISPEPSYSFASQGEWSTSGVSQVRRDRPVGYPAPPPPPPRPFQAPQPATAAHADSAQPVSPQPISEQSIQPISEQSIPEPSIAEQSVTQQPASGQGIPNLPEQPVVAQHNGTVSDEPPTVVSSPSDEHPTPQEGAIADAHTAIVDTDTSLTETWDGVAAVDEPISDESIADEPLAVNHQAVEGDRSTADPITDTLADTSVDSISEDVHESPTVVELPTDSVTDTADSVADTADSVADMADSVADMADSIADTAASDAAASDAVLASSDTVALVDTTDAISDTTASISDTATDIAIDSPREETYEPPTVIETLADTIGYGVAEDAATDTSGDSVREERHESPTVVEPPMGDPMAAASDDGQDTPTVVELPMGDSMAAVSDDNQDSARYAPIVDEHDNHTDVDTGADRSETFEDAEADLAAIQVNADEESYGTLHEAPTVIETPLNSSSAESDGGDVEAEQDSNGSDGGDVEAEQDSNESDGGVEAEQDSNAFTGAIASHDVDNHDDIVTDGIADVTETSDSMTDEIPDYPDESSEHHDDGILDGAFIDVSDIPELRDPIVPDGVADVPETSDSMTDEVPDHIGESPGHGNDDILDGAFIDASDIPELRDPVVPDGVADVTENSDSMTDEAPSYLDEVSDQTDAGILDGAFINALDIADVGDTSDVSDISDVGDASDAANTVPEEESASGGAIDSMNLDEGVNLAYLTDAELAAAELADVEQANSGFASALVDVELTDTHLAESDLTDVESTDAELASAHLTNAERDEVDDFADALIDEEFEEFDDRSLDGFNGKSSDSVDAFMRDMSTAISSVASYVEVLSDERSVDEMSHNGLSHDHLSSAATNTSSTSDIDVDIDHAIDEAIADVHDSFTDMNTPGESGRQWIEDTESIDDDAWYSDTETTHHSNYDGFYDYETSDDDITELLEPNVPQGSTSFEADEPEEDDDITELLEPAIPADSHWPEDDDIDDFSLLDGYDQIEQELDERSLSRYDDYSREGFSDDSFTDQDGTLSSVHHPPSPIPTYTPASDDATRDPSLNGLSKLLHASDPTSTGDSYEKPISEQDERQADDQPFGLDGFDVLDGLDAITDNLLDDNARYYSAADSDYSAADSDYSTADSDYSTADSDYSAADSDYSAADSDYSAVDSDYSAVDSDYSATDSDYSAAESLADAFPEQSGWPEDDQQIHHDEVESSEPPLPQQPSRPIEDEATNQWDDEPESTDNASVNFFTFNGGFTPLDGLDSDEFLLDDFDLNGLRNEFDLDTLDSDDLDTDDLDPDELDADHPLAANHPRATDSHDAESHDIHPRDVEAQDFAVNDFEPYGVDTTGSDRDELSLSDATDARDMAELIRGLETDEAEEEAAALSYLANDAPLAELEELGCSEPWPDDTDEVAIDDVPSDEVPQDEVPIDEVDSADEVDLSEALDEAADLRLSNEFVDELAIDNANDVLLVPDLIVADGEAEEEQTLPSMVISPEQQLQLFDPQDPGVRPLLQRIADLQHQQANPALIAEAYRNLGNFYRDRIEQGDLSPQNLIRSMQAYKQVIRGINDTNPMWAEVLNDMGNLCWLLSRGAPSPEQGLPHLQQGITSYRMALTRINPETHPQTYPMIQNNLGAAYGDLARYQDPVENLQQSIHAYQEALLYRSVDRDPLRYASTQNNLGTTYWNLAQHIDPVGNLKQAIASYSEALRLYRPDSDPLNYAMLQNNLGTTYWNLAQHEQSGDWLRLAIMAYETALRYRTIETNPAAFAATQNNLGTAYWHVATYVEDDADQKFIALEKAIHSYDEALSAVKLLQQSRQPTPLNFDVLATHNNLGLVQYQISTEQDLQSLERLVNTDYLNTAIEHHLVALQGWQGRPELRQTAFSCVIQTLQAIYNQKGLTAQNLALSKIPGHLLPEIMPKL